jgi:thiol-disulfide isomerase/thioredoxin
MPAPELDVAQWLNADGPLTLAALHGKVVVLHAFQMLCPACVKLSTPQAQELHQHFGGSGDLVVIGLHTVFEHHDVMTPTALAAYVHENRLSFPIAVDRPDGHGGIPATMRAYAMEGTPTLVLIDRKGQVRLNHFGHLPDLALGVAIGALLAEDRSSRPSENES